MDATKMSSEGLAFVRRAASDWYDRGGPGVRDIQAFIDQDNFAEYCANLAVECDSFDIGSFPSIFRVWEELTHV